MPSVKKSITIATLFLALGGPPLLAVISQYILGSSPNIYLLLPFDLILWAMFAIVLVVVIYVERLPLASIGIKRPRFTTIFWGLVLVLGINFMLSPIVMGIVTKLGLSGYQHGLTPLLQIPVWYQIFLAVSAGITEEVFYRGYAVERLTSLTGNIWIGSLIAVLAFGFSHIPGWGIGPSLVFMIDGAVVTLFYTWKRDLVTLIIAHVIGDTIGLVVLPPINPG